MNCSELRHAIPLYLSGELNAEEHQRVTSHLSACSQCAHDIEDQRAVDVRLAEAVARDSPDTSGIEQRVRQRISAERSRRRWIGVAAGLILAVAGSYGLFRLGQPPRAYADAARDHWAEVVEKQPRRWRSNAADIETVAIQNGFSLAQAEALAPVGYSLERAKICGLDGHRMLHLVFTNGVRWYSVYVRPDGSGKSGIRVIRQSSEQVAGFETGRFTAVVVTDGPAAECEELARLTAARL